MAIMAKYNEGGDFQHPPTGLCAAVCCDVVDLGETEQLKFNSKTETEMVPEVRVYFQVHHKMEDGRPFVVSIKFRNSMGEKANLRKFLEKWNDSKKMAEAKAKNFDLEKLIGIPATLNIVEKSDKKNRIWSNIDSVLSYKSSLHLTDGKNPLKVSADFVRKQDRKDEEGGDKKNEQEADQGDLFDSPAASTPAPAAKSQQGASAPPQQAAKAADLDTDPFAEDNEASPAPDAPF